MFQAVCRQFFMARVRITSHTRIMVLESYFLGVLRVILYASASIISLETEETISALIAVAI